MPFATVAENARTSYLRPEPRLCPRGVDDALTARRRSLEIAAAYKPLSRVAALLVSISRNNTYEGRDPALVPDTLTSGFVADLLGIDIASLAALLVELRRRGLIDNDPSSALRLKDLAGLERLADA